MSLTTIFYYSDDDDDGHKHDHNVPEAGVTRAFCVGGRTSTSGGVALSQTLVSSWWDIFAIAFMSSFEEIIIISNLLLLQFTLFHQRGLLTPQDISDVEEKAEGESSFKF